MTIGPKRHTDFFTLTGPAAFDPQNCQHEDSIAADTAKDLRIKPEVYEAFSVTARPDEKISGAKRTLQLLATERLFFEIVLGVVRPIAVSLGMHKDGQTTYFQRIRYYEKKDIQYSCPEDFPWNLLMIACRVGRCCACIGPIADLIETLPELRDQLSDAYQTCPEHRDYLKSMELLLCYATLRMKVHERTDFIEKLFEPATKCKKENRDFPFSSMFERIHEIHAEFLLKQKAFKEALAKRLESTIDDSDLMARESLDDNLLQAGYCSDLLECCKGYFEKDFYERIQRYASSYSTLEKLLKLEQLIQLKQNVRRGIYEKAPPRSVPSTFKSGSVWTRLITLPQFFASVPLVPMDNSCQDSVSGDIGNTMKIPALFISCSPK